MKRINGTAIETVDEVGEIRSGNSDLIKAACDAFLLRRGLPVGADRWKRNRRFYRSHAKHPEGAK